MCMLTISYDMVMIMFDDDDVYAWIINSITKTTMINIHAFDAMLCWMLLDRVCC